jgi:FAD/FMN-containing dehydrogenase
VPPSSRPAPSPLPCPPGFRGEWIVGTEARDTASRISGPFSAHPAAHAFPRDDEDLALLLSFARETGLSLIPRGGGTGMPGGNLGSGIVVDLSRHFRHVGPVAPETDCIRVEAGAVAEAVDRAARSQGLRLPALPSSAPWCTVGGMVANNAAGARSFRHGSIAAWVEGLEGLDVWGRPFRLAAAGPRPTGAGTRPASAGVSHPLPFPASPEALGIQGGDLPGSLSSGWPRVRKNASGYALDRYLAGGGDPVQLLVGSEGTLALITAVTLRLAPIPPARGVHLLPVDSPEALVEGALAAEATGAVACEFLGRRFLEVAELEDDPQVGPLARGAWALLFLEFEGAPGEVEEGMAAARAVGRNLSGEGMGTTDPEAGKRLWAVRHAASPMIARKASQGLYSTQFIEDSVVPPAALGTYLRGLDGALERHGFDAVVFGHAGDGNVHVNPLVDAGSPDWRDRVRGTLEEVVEVVAQLGGTLSGEHGDGRLRAPFLERVWGSELVAAFHRVKEGFDPEGRLNPGVILPLEGQDPLQGLRPRARAWPG